MCSHNKEARGATLVSKAKPGMENSCLRCSAELQLASGSGLNSLVSLGNIHELHVGAQVFTFMKCSHKYAHVGCKEASWPPQIESVSCPEAEGVADALCGTQLCRTSAASQDAGQSSGYPRGSCPLELMVIIT